MNIFRSADFDDIYFSPDDGPAETTHVFLNGNNLPAAWAGRDVFTVAELGFGTGLNFLMAASLFMKNNEAGQSLDYVAVEKSPLAAGAIEAGLRPFAARIGDALFEEYIAALPPRMAGFHRVVMGGGRIRLTLVIGDVAEALPEMDVPRGIDAWFLDGFAPAKNPAMWQPEIFAQMARLSAPGATFATFTVAGIVKRGLAAAGFTVEKRPGYGRKREMLAGRYDGAGVASAITVPRRVAVIGGGLAGTAAARMIAARGITPVIFEAAPQIAAGASGNPVGLCNPRLSAARTPQAAVYVAGYARAVRLFPCMDAGFTACGNLHLTQDAEREKKFSGTAAYWGWAAEHLQMLDAGAASDVAGAALPCGGLHLSDTGAVDPGALCRAYAAVIDVRTGVAVMPERDGAGWRVGDEYFDAVVAANGTAARLFTDAPMEPVRGQITFARADGAVPELRTNLCYGGYLGAARDGLYTVGATFQRGQDDTTLRAADDAENIAKLAALLPDIAAHMIPVSSRAAVRCASRDRFPVAGVAGENLYVSAAHGSHGIVTTLAAAEMIADMMAGTVLSLPVTARAALSPERFARRAR
jgi:tRNA 5-methylaminomethyl-2-thiouridine biosynthesis bifunctional protein